MGKLYRLGDSWSQTMPDKYPDEHNHSYYIAEHYGLEYVNVGYGGAACSDIITQLVSIMFNCETGDMILINIPSLDRVGYLDNENNYIDSTKYSNEEMLKMNSIAQLTDKELQYSVNNNIVHQLNKILHELDKRGVQVFTMYNDTSYFFETINLISANFTGWVDGLGFKDLSPKGNLHYLYGTQEKLAQEIIKLIDEKI